MHIDFSKLQQEYKNLEYSPFKLSCIKNAIQSAAEEKEYYWKLKFMEDYIQEVTFEGDLLLEMLMFPEYITLYDAHPELHQKYSIKNILKVYKWILADISGFYQISYEKCLEYFEDFKKRCIANGISLSYYYKLWADFLEDTDINEKRYKKAIKNYYAKKRENFFNCELCELNSKVSFEIYYGSFEKALKLAKPILEGEKKCINIPHCTYNNFLDYYITHNNMEKAAVYEKLLIKEIKENHLADISTLLHYYGLTDIHKGIKMWKKYIDSDIKNHFPLSQFYFEKEACFLLKKVKEETKKRTLKIILPKEFPLYKADNTYTIDELIKYYQKNVIEIAQKFDERNGNNKYIKNLEYLNF